jgi:hypothetical protein
MEHRKAFLTLLMVCLGFTLFAQTEGKVFVVEALVCDSTGAAIRDVAVYDGNNDLRSITDRDGIARIATRKGETLYLSHLGYKTKSIEIEDKSLMDSEDGRKAMVVVMQHKTNTLAEVTVTENAPHLAYANKKVWVIDYKVQHDGIYMVAGNGTDYCLLHLGFEQDTISRKPVFSKFQELYSDAFGNLQLISSDSVYQVYCDGKKLHLLYGNSIETFRQKLEPIKLLTDSIMVLQKYVNRQQQLAYLMVNRNNKQVSVMADLRGEALEMAQNARMDAIRDQRIDRMIAEAEESSQSEGRPERAGALAMQRMEMNFSTDENEVEARRKMMSNAFNRIMFKPIYCPALYIGDTIYVFDFENDYMLKYDNRGSRVDSCGIAFHRTGYFKNLLINNPWDKKLIVDEATNQCYAQFSTDGIVTLKEIDLGNGRVKREIRLTDHYFPQNIQVYNGEVYYMFLDSRQTNGRDRRSLYKMRLE